MILICKISLCVTEYSNDCIYFEFKFNFNDDIIIECLLALWRLDGMQFGHFVHFSILLKVM